MTSASRITGLASVPLMAAALLAAGCGQSKEDQATATVCNARADIGKHVSQLESMTPSTATPKALRQSMQAIAGDLSTIRGAQGDLNDQRKQQVQDANATFSSQVKSVGSQIRSGGLSLSGAGSQLTDAAHQLAGAYKTSLAKVDCSDAS